MPKRIAPLSETQVRNAKPKDKEYKLMDGFGLFLLVTPTSGKLWRFDYRLGDKRKTMALGAYPEVSLAEARQRREDAKKLLANGVDPGEIKKAQKAAVISSNEKSLEVVARAWHAGKVEGWAESHAKTTMERLEKNIFPWLGAMPVSEIKLSDIKPVLHRIEERAPESARRMYVALNMIFRYCVASEFIGRNPFEGLKPKDIMRREPIEKHFPALTQPHELAPLLRAIDDFKGSFVVKCALQLAPLVFVRPGELRHAEWSEIDFDKAEWNIPIEKMKLSTKEKIKRKGDFHCVPLSRQAMEIFKAIQPLTGRSPYVFPGARSYFRPMSEAALTAAIHRMGFQGEMTWHGFRAVARTLIDEVLQIRPDFIEHQLAHAVRDALGRAYNRTSHLAERKKMMQQWADYLDGLKTGAKVIRISDRTAK
ncbi:integrase [Geotalea uraniireducens]|uniref:Integrase n=1 Tax=Geotalea uraniireducens TaxID=351604 RepID=A0ABM8ELI3_9BACT|nr:integrase arm-type DNA-binding domain-containing protein [Geotalea uraniireducens]BDV43408.1 integrase [Geotalea uraniireducens]